MEEKKFVICVREPVYPVIVISKDQLRAAFNIEELAKCCMTSVPEEDSEIVKAIDFSAEEFWYSPKRNFISPGFTRKRWSKKKIVELYNSCDLVSDEDKYSTKSLSSKRRERIISDICKLLKDCGAS
ncbi:MAG: hypothetical protein WGN25_17070 [Candidatus Electrothrix sp. GW3-4]|uniref:hypothetical protein n=1 Tax=Candidatus Electrothrix sp. GW3-4 TaxID=3126740 RepID=UPI0030D44C72